MFYKPCADKVLPPSFSLSQCSFSLWMPGKSGTARMDRTIRLLILMSNLCRLNILMQMWLWRFILIASCLCSAIFGADAIYLRDNLLKAKPGDYVVTAQGQHYTLLLIRDKEKLS